MAKSTSKKATEKAVAEGTVDPTEVVVQPDEKPVEVASGEPSADELTGKPADQPEVDEPLEQHESTGDGDLDRDENEEFPSLEGDESKEIAQRTADSNDERSEVYTKKFVIFGPDVPFVDRDKFDENNARFVEAELTQKGLRLTGAVTRTGAETHPDGVSIIVTYEAEVGAAAVTPTAETSTVEQSE